MSKRNFEVLAGEDATLLPMRATQKSAGYDLMAKKDYVVKPSQTVKVDTGVTVKMQGNEECQIRPRSGLAFKFGVTVLNAPGTIDADYYPGEIGVLLHNTAPYSFTVRKGDKIAQAVFSTYLVTDDDRSDKERDGGFGSTDQ